LRIGSIGQSCTTLCTAASQNFTTIRGCHTLPEAVLHLTVPLLRLICSLHGNRHSFSFVSSNIPRFLRRDVKNHRILLQSAVRIQHSLRGLIIQENRGKVKRFILFLCTLSRKQRQPCFVICTFQVHCPQLHKNRLFCGIFNQPICSILKLRTRMPHSVSPRPPKLKPQNTS